ncbi:MAG: hypothetical protein IJW86_01230 [Clostridia bacterium]|nr:hypothetical protein [Clostridia bacterium]
MSNHLKQKISLVIMAFISSQLWYIFLVDGLCDTAAAIPGLIAAQILEIALPLICCLIWDKITERKRFAFVLVYFVVLSTCDYLHSFLFAIFHEIASYFNINNNYMLLKNLLTAFMVIFRMVFSYSLLSWVYKYILILVVPKEDRKKYKK